MFYKTEPSRGTTMAATVIALWSGGFYRVENGNQIDNPR
jgi:hypothetical protein